MVSSLSTPIYSFDYTTFIPYLPLKIQGIAAATPLIKCRKVRCLCGLSGSLFTTSNSTTLINFVIAVDNTCPVIVDNSNMFQFKLEAFLLRKTFLLPLFHLWDRFLFQKPFSKKSQFQMVIHDKYLPLDLCPCITPPRKKFKFVFHNYFTLKRIFRFFALLNFSANTNCSINLISIITQHTLINISGLSLSL